MSLTKLENRSVFLDFFRGFIVFLLITDLTTGLVSDYQILSVQEEICFLKGIIPFVIDTMGFTINSEIDIEMQLNKQ